MIKTPITLQELRRRIYLKARDQKSWRFWGLFVHICKMETLKTAYRETRKNDGAPGVDAVTFKDIESAGLESFLMQIRNELTNGTYHPMKTRKVEIPKSSGKTRTLSISTIRDRVVQGALKLILEPIFEADFQPGSYGYRPKRNAHQALKQVANGIAYGKTQVIDLDLKAYFDNVRHHIILAKVAERVQDDDVMALLKKLLKSAGKKGLPQGSVLSPLLSNVYLTEVDKMLEGAKEFTRQGKRVDIEYARFADDLVVLINPKGLPDLMRMVMYRLREEFGRLGLEVNEAKSRVANLEKGEKFGFLGFTFMRRLSRRGKWCPIFVPQASKRTALLSKLKKIFRYNRSQPLENIVGKLNQILRGWVRYFAVGNSSRCFSYVRNWVEKKIRTHLMRARKSSGFGWDRWSSNELERKVGIYNDYRIVR